jgi:hypothetical protein
MDIYQPYVDNHRAAKDYKNCFQFDIMERQYSPKTYDAVIMCDVLEHLDKVDVERAKLLDRIESCARKKVILFTPNGFTENDEVDGDPYQKHQSAWEPEDFIQRGYKVVGATGARALLGQSALPKYRPQQLFALAAILSQPFIFDNPQNAIHSYAVKDVRNAQ